MANGKKAVPERVRVEVAIRYGAIPGETVTVPCAYCGTAGTIYWYARKDGKGSCRVRFGHELDHFEAESAGGKTDASNIVLACRRCNRSKGARTWPLSVDAVSPHCIAQ